MAGIAGRMDRCQQALRYLVEGGDKPTIEKDEFSILLIDRKGQSYSYMHTFEPIETPIPWAIGSGDDFALGAMAVGANALKAAQAAATLDVHCGDGFDVYKVKRK